ncbi:hypothetical protein BC941DRAFT_352823, partial [Chlamydoabsidia padenii]
DFVTKADPIVNNVKTMASEIDDQLKTLIRYYGEDPALIKPEDFFSTISTFSLSFQKAKIEVYHATEKASRRPKQDLYIYKVGK